MYITMSKHFCIHYVKQVDLYTFLSGTNYEIILL